MVPEPLADKVSPWDFYDKFTIHEAVVLLAGRDPSTLDPLREHLDPLLSGIREALRRSSDYGDLQVDVKVFREDDGFVWESWDEGTIKRSDLVAWVHKRGNVPESLARDPVPSFNPPINDDARAVPFECPEYLKRWIELLLQGYELHWKDRHPTDPDEFRFSIEEVKEWFEGQAVNGMRIEPTVAKFLARVIKHPRAPEGRRTDTALAKRPPELPRKP